VLHEIGPDGQMNSALGASGVVVPTESGAFQEVDAAETGTVAPLTTACIDPGYR
jgi:hypothetical protein